MDLTALGSARKASNPRTASAWRITWGGRYGMGLSFLYLAAPMVHGTMALFDWVSVGVEFDLGTEHPAMHPENVRRHIRRRCSRQRSGLRFRWRRFRLGLRVDGASVKIVQ